MAVPDPRHRYVQRTETVKAGEVTEVEINFYPDLWYLVPEDDLPDLVYVSPTKDIDVKSTGIPIQGTGPSTVPGIRQSKKIYIYNSDNTVDVKFSITAMKGVQLPSTSAPRPRKKYIQQKVTVQPQSEKQVTVDFIPDTWYIVPEDDLPSTVYVSPTDRFDPATEGIPVQSAGPSTVPGVDNSKTLYIYNTNPDVAVEFSVTSIKGAPAPTTSANEPSKIYNQDDNTVPAISTVEVLAYREENLTRDGEFENFSGTADDGVSDDWTEWVEIGGGSGDLLEAVTSSYSGSYAIKLTYENNGCWIKQEIEVIEGERYKLIFRTKGDGTLGGRYGVYDLDNGSYIIGPNNTEVYDNSEWHRYEDSFKVPAGCGAVQILLFSPAGAAGYALFDKVSLHQAFIPDTWYIVPKTTLPSPVFASPTASLDPEVVGIPIQGSNPSTIPGVNNSKRLFLYNSDADNDVEFSVTAVKGLPAPVTSTPTVITEAEDTGVWQVLTDQSIIEWDLAKGSGEVTLGGDRQIGTPSNVVAGKNLYLLIKQDSTGGRNLTWADAFLFPGGAKPRLSDLPNMWDLLEFFTDQDDNVIFQAITKNVTSEFSPLDIGSLWGWYKADTFTTLTDGDVIGNWPDDSGNGHAFSQGTVSYQPKWRENVINSKPGVQFDGVDDILSLSGWPSAFTVCTVAAYLSDSGDVTQHVFEAYDTGANDRVALRGKGVGDYWLMQNISSNINGLEIVFDNYELHTMIHAGSGGEFYQNGTLKGTDGNTLTGWNEGYMGAREDQARHANCMILEMIVFNIDLTDAQRQDVEEYLRGKYNLW